MRVGIMADIHDNVDNLRHAIGLFNALECGAILLAGDFVSPLVVPSMRRFTCPVIACYGDNDGNQIGIAGGMKIVGTLGYPPMCWKSRDGVKFLMAHPDTIVSSERLLQDVWLYPPGTGDAAVVRWHVKNLRRKIELNPESPVYLRTISHHGYMLVSDPTAIR